MKLEYKTQRALAQRWTELDLKKASILSDAREYARWTLPGMFPDTGTKSIELQLAKDSIGAQAVNHLSNKVVSTLFPPQRMFFRLHITQEMREMVTSALAMQAQQGNPGGQNDTVAAVSRALAGVEQELAGAEKKASEYMDMVQYRPQAVNAAKLMIITGNALEFHPPGKPVQIYNLYDYCIVRDLSGEVVEIMTKECKAFETFNPNVQDQIRQVRVKDSRQYRDKDDVTIYTRVVLEEDGKYHVYQSADLVVLDTVGAVFTKDTLPWIPLTWNLIRGEDYGRGLVAEYAGAFHAINTLAGSLLNIVAITGDIKFFVNPASLVDIPTLNASPPGSYHPGKEGDVTVVAMDALNKAQFIMGMIERYEKQIAQAFLLNSAVTRQAERVTAEEIRLQANELETSNGGIYSRLAGTWQVALANILLHQTDFDGAAYGIVPRVITGMDSLSRQGELDSLQMFLQYLGLLNTVPEDARQRIDLSALMALIGTNMQVDYKGFLKSEAQLKAEQEQAMQQQQQIEQMQANRESQVAASKQAMMEQ